MIFNESNTRPTISLDNIEPSKYTLGLEGALMHLCECERNWNAIMKSVGISEMRYAIDHNGADLFVNEAGALGGFISKIKEFFKKIFEKIKAIVKKVLMLINSFTMKDKEFVKKYEKDLRKVNMADFEFNGYDFNKTEKFATELTEDIKTEVDNVTKYVNQLKVNDSIDINNIDTILKGNGINKTNIKDITQDDIDSSIEAVRARAIKDGSSKYTESEFREELRNKLYGDKETLDNKQISISWCLQQITDTKECAKIINKLDKDANKIFSNIDTAYSHMEKLAYSKEKSDSAADGADSQSIKDNTDIVIKTLDVLTKILKGGCSTYLIITGMLAQRVKDKNRQCKAICVKAVNYKPKNESAGYYDDGSAAGDIFSQVEFM